jgi:hypothetical protein
MVYRHADGVAAMDATRWTDKSLFRSGPCRAARIRNKPTTGMFLRRQELGAVCPLIYEITV